MILFIIYKAKKYQIFTVLTLIIYYALDSKFNILPLPNKNNVLC